MKYSTIFKTFDGDKGFLSKIGVFNKSFVEIGKAFGDALNLSIEGAFDDTLGDQGFFKNFKNNLTTQVSEVNDLYSKLFVTKNDIEPFKITDFSIYEQSASNIMKSLQDTKKDVEAGDLTWQEYFDGLKEGEKWQAKFVQENDLSKISLEDVDVAQKAAKESAIAYNNGLDQMTIGAKAGQVALKGLALVGNLLAMAFASWVTTEIISWLNDLAHAEENARKRSEELTSSYEDEKKNIDDSIAKYKELNDKLQDNSLSTSEVYDMKSQLKDIQDKLIESFGNEADGIDLVNGKYDEQIAKLDTLSKQKATDYVAENNANIKSDEDYVYGKLDDFYPYVGRSKDFDYKLDDNTIKEIFDKYDKVGIAINEGVYHLTANGTREEVHKQLVDIYNELDEFKDNPALQKFKTNISTIVSDKTFFDSDQLEKSKNNLKKYTEAEILSNDNASKSYNDLVDAVDNYNTALETGKGVDEAKQKLLETKQAAEDSTKDITNSGKVLQDVYNSLSSEAPIEFQVEIGKNVDEELKQSYNDTINRFKTKVDARDVQQIKNGTQDRPSNEDASKISTFLDMNGISQDLDSLTGFNEVTADITDADEAIQTWTDHVKEAGGEVKGLPTTMAEAWKQLNYYCFYLR